MKKIIGIIFVLILFGCSSSAGYGDIVSESFIFNFGSDNYRIRGEMYTADYNKDLSTLTYEVYLAYLRDHQGPMVDGLYQKIQLAKDYYFTADKKSFYVVLWYPSDKIVVVDDAYTPKVDDVIFLDSKADLKPLDSYLHKTE